MCNCKDTCPLNGQCRRKNVIYKIIFQCDNWKCEICYIGATGRFVKTRWREHRRNIFKLRKGGKANYSLAQHIEKCPTCSLNIEETVKSWRIEIIKNIKHPTKRGTEACSLCQEEKIQIMLGFSNKDLKLCNSRNECLQHCKHRACYPSYKPLLKPKKYADE